MHDLIEKVNKWFDDRNLIEGSTDKDQILKLMQELGELSDHACKGEDIRDDLGDMLVVMLNIMKRNNYSINECLQIAYDDIKDRKGKMVDGIFVKESKEEEKMIEVLNHIDDIKKIRQLLLEGKVKEAVKECDVVITYKQQEVEEFEKWAEKESKKEVK